MSVAGAPDILYVPLPEPPTLSRWRLFRLLTGCLIASVAIAVVIAVLPATLPRASYAATALVIPVLGIGSLVLTLVHEIRSRRRYRRLVALDPNDDLATATARLLLSRRVGRSRTMLSMLWDEFDQERVRRGIPPLNIVVDEALREPLAGTLTDHLLEPERVLPGRDLRSLAMLAGTGGLAGWCLAVGGLSFPGALLVGFFLIVLLQSPLLVWLPILGDNLPVAGPGYVDLRPGRRMTVKDSVMIVARGLRRHSVQVWLTGPAGMLTWQYPRINDPHFVALWQRWAHPKPRLDLDTA